MHKFQQFSFHLVLPCRSSALLIVLGSLAMISTLVIALLLVARYERLSSHLALSRVESSALADLAANLAMTKLRNATELGMQKSNLWISEPGRIRVYKLNDLNEVTDFDLFSSLPGPDTSTTDENNVDLNLPNYRGRHPIAPPAEGNSLATMKIGWVSVPTDPSKGYSSNNPIAGRIAYWVDDESCKININTADGSQKYTTNSFGFGTPSEINLQVLRGETGSNVSADQASKISTYAWEKGFNSFEELGQVPQLPEGLAEQNRFQLTHYSKTPELTFYGEPRIYLFPVMSLPNSSELLSHNLGSYFYAAHLPLSGFYPTGNIATRRGDSGPIDFVYPTSAQLPLMELVDANNDGSKDKQELTQFTQQYHGRGNNQLGPSTQNYAFASRISHALGGIDSKGTAFNWPNFTGSPTGGLPAKYNKRQLDSIALSICDMSTEAVSANQNRGYTIPAFVNDGMLSGKRAIGIGRSPKLTEFYFSFDAFEDVPPYTGATSPISMLQADMALEFYFPENYAGAYFNSWDMQASPAKGSELGSINTNDHFPKHKESRSSPSPTGTYWNDTLLRVVDTGHPTEPLAGIDFRAHNRALPDPDPIKSAVLHPYAKGMGGSQYYATVNPLKPTDPIPLFSPVFRTLMLTKREQRSPTKARWAPGTYFGIQATEQGAIALYAKPTMLGQFGLRGGFNIWTRDGAGQLNWELVPLDSARNSRFSQEDPKDILAELQEAVIPVPANFNIAIPSFDNVWHGRVADPLVNKFPGDWIITKNPSSSSMTMEYDKNPELYTTEGHNPEYLPSKGGDPLSIWLPLQDVNYPKQSRFPSVGALNYIRTGVIPDDLSVSLQQQKGTPWRSLNLSATSNASQSISGKMYPDWAILDLFTVPFTPQLPYLRGENPTPIRLLTHGGATEGKINLNNPLVPYPFNQTVPNVNQTPPERTTPLEALFYGIQTSNSYSSSGEPVYATVDRTTATNLRKAVHAHLDTKGPFLLPGQLAEVPAIDAYTYRGVAQNAQSRNDLMREVVGATTTQSNVFSIWVVSQTIKKIPGNTRYDRYEPGDVITGEIRRRYLVERHIDYGRDGVPGNANDPGPDNVIGTNDDPIDPLFHPKMTYPLPYRWKIIATENVST